MKTSIILYICLLGLSACDFFRSRPNMMELKGIVQVDSIHDMQVYKTSATDIFVDKGLKYDMDDYINVVDYVPLETNENILIGNIDKLLIYKDKIYILDVNKAKSIFIFHRNGSFISKISQYGQGTNEYKYLRDMEIDMIRQQIVAYDRNGGKLLFYDLDGNFIETQQLGFRFSDFKIFPNGTYLFYTDNNQNNFAPSIAGYSLLIGQANGKIFYRALKNNSFIEKLNYSSKYNIFDNCGEMFVSPRLSNALYEVKSDGVLNKLYQMHLPSGNMEDYFQLDPSRFTEEIADKGYYYSLGGNIFVNDSLFYFSFNSPVNIVYSLWYNRNNKKYHCINQNYSSSGRIIFVPNPLFSYNNQCVGAIDAVQVIQSRSSFIEAHKNLRQKDSMREQTLFKINSMKEDDNPLLMFYTIKWH